MKRNNWILLDDFHFSNGVSRLTINASTLAKCGNHYIENDCKRRVIAGSGKLLALLTHDLQFLLPGIRAMDSTFTRIHSVMP